MVRPRLHTDAEILAVAREVFIELGPTAPLSEVATRLGLTQPALSKRFGSKRALLRRALLRPIQSDWIARLDAGPDARPFPEQLHALCMDAMAVLRDAIPSMLALRAEGLPKLQELVGDEPLPHERVRRSLVAFFARAVEAGQIRGVDPEHVAMLVLGGVQSRVLMAHVAGESLDEDECRAHASAVVDVMWRGLHPASTPTKDRTKERP